MKIFYSVIFGLGITLFFSSSLLGGNSSQPDFLTFRALAERRCHRPHRPRQRCPNILKDCCKRGRRGPTGPTGPIGPTGTTGMTGATGSQGSPFSSAAASRVIISLNYVCIPIGALENFPFALPGDGGVGTILAEQGISYDSSTNSFVFSQTGFYLISYGFVLANSTSDALAALYLGGTKVIGSEIYNHEPRNMCDATVVIPISDISQQLSLVNTSLGTLDLMPNPYPNVDGLSPPTVAFMTITRVADLP